MEISVTTILLIINIILICIIFAGALFDFDRRVYVEAFDGTRYKVRDTTQKQETADTLARLNERALQLIRNLARDEKDPDMIPIVSRLGKRYRKDTLSEGVLDENYTSYTVNKGEDVVMCMRTRDEHDQLYDLNLLFYVLLHEMAHIACTSDDHTPEFEMIFQYLMSKAERYGLFKRATGKQHYCGVDVHGM